MSDSPNYLRAGWSMLWARRVSTPRPRTETETHHDDYRPVLDELARSGVPGLGTQREALARYRHRLESVDPDTLSRPGALAYWLNLYNAGALDLAARAAAVDAPTVWRVPGCFTRPWATVAGEKLSLDDIEHGKVRRFDDPRVHAALVCGSVSCPTLRYEPFTADALDRQLDDQMRTFLESGGAVRTDRGIELSRIFKWYGGDFVWPDRMPTLRPARPGAVLEAVTPWLHADVVSGVDESTSISFQAYDWALACVIA